MKTRVLSLTVLLLAGAASGALAQDRYPRAGGDAGSPPASGAMQRWSRQSQSQSQAAHEPAAPEAKPAPAAPPRAPRPDDRGADRAPSQIGGPRGPGGVRVEEHDRRVDERRGDDRRIDGGRDDHRFDGRDRSPDARERDQGLWDRRDDNRHDRRDDRRNDRARPDGGRDRDRNWDRNWDRDRDRGRRDGPRWEQRRYPPIYNSPSRYRGPSWRPPYGYYARSWRFGEILPRGWYGEQYRILDWWEYGLPEPPYGYDWVRVGPDVLLIDSYTGRIAQVVRLVFW